MAVKFAWTLAAGCVAVLCGCEGIAGIEDISLATDAGDVDGDAGDLGEGGSEATVDAFAADAGTVDSDASATDAADGSDAFPPLDTGIDRATDAPGVPNEANLDGSADGTATDDSPVDSTIPGETGVLDGTVDSSTPTDASDASVLNDVGDASVSTDAGDAAVVGDASLQLVLIDDQAGTSSGLGWLDGPNLKGTWFVFADALSTIKPLSDAGPAAIIGTQPRAGGANVNAAHTSGVVGTSSTTSNAGMGFNLINGTASYDASAYKGVVFWARSGLDAGTTIARFQVRSLNTASYSFIYGEDLHLTGAWTQFVVRFSDLTPNSWYTGDAGPPTFVDQAALISCQFQFAATTTFDIWVDDVYFLVSL